MTSDHSEITWLMRLVVTICVACCSLAVVDAGRLKLECLRSGCSFKEAPALEIAMSRSEYDIVTVGGGLGGAALATVMAKAGARVLVVEREERFQDRVRGEFMEPWGVAETIRLGIYNAIRSAANETPWWQLYLGEMKIDRRDCVATTPHKLPNLGIYHPALQELVLAEAVKAGAEVRRGALVREVRPGNPRVSLSRGRGAPKS